MEVEGAPRLPDELLGKIDVPRLILLEGRFHILRSSSLKYLTIG